MKYVYLCILTIISSIYIYEYYLKTKEVPITNPSRSLTTDKIEITNKNGEIYMSIYSEPSPIIEVKNSKGKIYRMDIAKLAERLQSFNEEKSE